MAEDALKTGTTTIGLKCKDGVIMASERRATMGHIIAHSNVQKVYKIADNIGMTIAGLVGDAQLMVRYAQSEVALYSMKRGEPMSVKAASTLVANIIRQGFYVGLIVGGYDKTGGHVFSIDGAGGHIEDNYMSVGSGSSFAMGVIEEKYKEGMTREEGIDLAIAALNSSIRRDSASGDGMLISFIGPDGFESVPEEDIRARAAELGFRYPN
ncbi:MAG: archaeal proteasome endopeptidase complex subunit beta [Candidatus Methanomethylophilaceae archaeon]|jgi:proteasome beta subunit|nr:archaeal proteasome endopeptidase complex subunit beta [Candidatus Methanomethylophilaceae archaeon]MDD3128025.1 archaeal proteasome endopeptidase complex subunit beta [Candidatus Methanomethylophilaceae archaeon]MDD4119513.1 archaeal proteasome endopeptidase complex subunit beta [Candidatus Methanomethylophilaceae archaeon]MDD4454127.1 archaeal proteasome endopeptidase complex subunit beta [Candidatus Methanomethylophilaceae archaeon]MDI9379074.1 archaeal proteasome endopeptidase complex su